MTPAARIGSGVAAGVIVSAAVAWLASAVTHPGAPHEELVPEDASGHLERIAIHYVPAMDPHAMPVWDQLFRALPTDVEVEVAVDYPRDFDRLLAELAARGVAHRERFHPVVVGVPLTTWSRDRMASLRGPEGGGVLAPPRIAVADPGRAGDWEAPFAIARDVYARKPQLGALVFEGGDFAASAHHVFADANLIARNRGRGDATLAHLQAAVAHTFAQDLVWLGDARGDVPEHHIMMYMVPLDDESVLVGDVRMGLALDDGVVAADPHVDDLAARFDHVADLLAARGFRVTRIPVVVLPGAGSYITYTNAVFDRTAAPSGDKIVYLPTYGVPALDGEATRVYRALGYRVVPIDVSTIYTLNGSLGCLVNVMARTHGE